MVNVMTLRIHTLPTQAILTSSRTGLLIVLLTMNTMTAKADKVDDYIRAQMAKRSIPGLSLAVIENGKIVKAQGYGVLEKGSQIPVTPSTLFQAASISKSVTAAATLTLVEQGKLSLDEDVNARLTTWKVPENEYTKQKKVTLRGLLSHTAGLTVSGFPGYVREGPLPTLTQILDGETPANTPAIRVDILPGSEWRYSGGGYVVLRQLLLDVTGEPFPQFMQERVLGPLDMKSSTFEQPLPNDRAKFTAAANYLDGTVVKGRWHVYPEMAPDGLWTTPSDLARFAIGLQRSAAGKPNSILSQATIRQMFTVEMNGYGLGVGVEGKGASLRFQHGGRNEGFDSVLMAYAVGGQGAVIMVNANENSGTIDRILKVIGEVYHWPDFPRLPNIKLPPVVPMTAQKLVGYEGRYEFSNNNMITLRGEQGKLIWRRGNEYDDELHPSGEDIFVSLDHALEFHFAKNSQGEVTHFTLNSLSGEPTSKIADRPRPRIGPLIHTLPLQADTDPALTQKVESALKAFAQGGKAVAEAADLTPGARKDLSGLPLLDFAGIRSVSFLAAQDVTGRGIERHGGQVSRILTYKLVTDKATRYVLIHLTANGLITDEDVVDD